MDFVEKILPDDPCLVLRKTMNEEIRRYFCVILIFLDIHILQGNAQVSNDMMRQSFHFSRSYNKCILMNT